MDGCLVARPSHMKKFAAGVPLLNLTRRPAFLGLVDTAHQRRDDVAVFRMVVVAGAVGLVGMMLR